MREDVVIGLTVSALLHAGLLFGFPHHPLIKAVTIPDKNPGPFIEMTKYVPDDPEPVDTTSGETKPIDFAPPMRPDLPQPKTTSSFVQPVQPSPPENLKPTPGIMVIPDGRNSGNFPRDQAFDPKSLDQQPVARVTTPPPYPFEMKRNGTPGEVLIDFIVDTNGDVRNAFAISATNHEFEQAAVQGVSKWKFKPGRKGGRTVNTHMQVPLVFSLSD